jgi:hypothetical protein
MELTNKILDMALLSELAYLKLENKYFKDEDYSFEIVRGFLRDNNKDITGIDDNRDEAIIDLLRNYTIVDFVNIPTKKKGDSRHLKISSYFKVATVPFCN